LIDAGAGIEAGSLNRRRLGPWIALGLCGAIAVGVGLGAALHSLGADHGGSAAQAQGSASGLHGEATWAAGAKAAPAISALRDQSGRVFSLGSLHGRTVAMAFFDSHCTQACPLEGRAIAASERSLARSQRPVLVVVSVNPADTAASTRAAIRKWGLAGIAPWHWLRGSHAQLVRVWRDYHIFVAPPRDGDISHTEALYLIDRRGDERSGYLYPFAPRFVTLDLGTLARERAS
jgi:cytochrome oxidase Cu insertion factor (SCO1/SenC/PrrC family)